MGLWPRTIKKVMKANGSGCLKSKVLWVTEMHFIVWVLQCNIGLLLWKNSEVSWPKSSLEVNALQFSCLGRRCPGGHLEKLRFFFSFFFRSCFCLFISLFLWQCRCCGNVPSAKCTHQAGSCVAHTIQFARKQGNPCSEHEAISEVGPAVLSSDPAVAPIPAC